MSTINGNHVDSYGRRRSSTPTRHSVLRLVQTSNALRSMRSVQDLQNGETSLQQRSCSTGNLVDPIEEAQPQLPTTHPNYIDVNGRSIVAVRYGKGTMQYVKYSTTEPPTGQSSNPPRCGFCHGNNMMWQLQCSFCSCQRLRNTPRMLYIINMLLSLEPQMTGTKAIAIEAEKTFRQATMVRTRVAMKLMSRTTDALRMQIVRMMFYAWRKLQAETKTNEEIMARLIRIKEMQAKTRLKGETFRAWGTWAYISMDDRAVRLSIALDKRKTKIKHRVWTEWMRFVINRLRKRCSHLKSTLMYNILLNTWSSNSLLNRSNDETRTSEELLQLKSVLSEIKGSLVTAMDHIIAVTTQAMPYVNSYLQGLLHQRALAPDTIGYALDMANSGPIFDALTAHDISVVAELDIPKESIPFAYTTTLELVSDRLKKQPPWQIVLNWLSNMISIINESSGHKVLVPMATLEDIFTQMKSPKLVLNLLWYFAPASLEDYNRLYEEECARDPLLASSSTHHGHHVQWKLFFQIASTHANLSHAIANREQIENEEFDAFYTILLHFYLLYSYHIKNEPLTTEITQSIEGVWSGLRHDIFHVYDTDIATRESCRNLLHDVDTIQHAQLRLLTLHHHTLKLSEQHKHQALLAGLVDFGRRVDGKEALVSIALKQQSLVSHLKLEYSRCEFMCNSRDEFNAIQLLFTCYIVPIMNVYKASAISNGGVVLTEQEFYKLIAECGVLDRKLMSRGYLQGLVQHTTEKHDNLNSNERVLTSHEFAEALVRVSHHLTQKLASTNESTTIVEVARRLIEEQLIPMANELEKFNMTSFKRQIGHADVQAVLKSFDKKLKKLFAFYAVERRGKCINLSEFESWLKDQHLVDALFPYQRVKQVFMSAMHHNDTSVADLELELIFSEFIEAIIAVTVFRNPNPYIPLAERLEMFLNVHLQS
ncbi:hypothetical protein THRCLA_04042 [Thraustotheca clavata]|uniref:Uncharacterized protein n=1 Tax=Thraustotheca clavata TaxID=74557 RepID=A0A1W0A027_9STRA|nr:hypothetical protein THRCLA_04042 [Thraustotheca clavata]